MILEAIANTLAWSLIGLLVCIALLVTLFTSALADALAATPAPLDALCTACGHNDPHVKNGGCGLDLMREGPPPFFVQCMCDGKSGSSIVRFWTDDPAPLDGTLTECPMEGVHEHLFRGPHRFREWEPGS